MSMVLTAAFLLMLASLSSEVDVEIIMKSEPGTEVDTAPHELQAEEKLYGNPCISKKTCGECIRAHHMCAWCAKQDMSYTAGSRPRCNNEEIIKDECGDNVLASSATYIEDSKGYFSYVRYDNKIQIYIRFYPKWNVPLVAFRFDNPPENVVVKTYYVECHGWSRGWEENINYCTDVKKGDHVIFMMLFEVLSCPENTDEWNPIMQFHVLEGEHVVVVREVNLGLLCKCLCELPENQEKNSPKCSGRGTYHCGVCSCHDKWYGKECECEGKPTGENDDKACVAPGDTKICSGRGRCCSGICQCFNKTSMTGRFCECDVCPQSEDGQICGGEDHGKCVCGKCECTDEWTGPACDCTKDIKACRSPYNGLICHGSGECKCGKCQCFEKDGILHKGRYCETCPTHTNSEFLQCERFKGCFECFEFY